MKQSEITWWCRNLWAQIKLGGVWGVPRSGLLFRKTAEGFNLCDVARPVSESFKVYQKQDFTLTKRHFALAGLNVTDSYNLLGASAPSGEGVTT